MNCKFASVFVIVLAMVLTSSQGKSIHDIKDHIHDIKVPLIVAKVGIAKAAAAKIKFAAIKKLAAVKAIAAAPFILGKKAALLKINAIKSLGAYKAATAHKILDYASEKTAPAVAAVAGIPALLASIPAAAVAAIKPKPAPHSQVTHHTEVVDVYTYPATEQHKIPVNTHYYKTGLDGPRTYSNDYSLVPENNSGSYYYPVADIIQPHNTYGVPAV